MSSEHDLSRVANLGIILPKQPLVHRNDEYDEVGFETLIRMQRDHFWYRGRHKFLLDALRREVTKGSSRKPGARAVDLGGGCGGWLEYLHAAEPQLFSELALGDSSLKALRLAEPIVGRFANRYQIDLLNLGWHEAWDCVFLLDVIEHVSDDYEAISQIRQALRPGGLLFVTTPALNFFWSYNDVAAHHYRRYSRLDFVRLGEQVKMDLVRADYFMFLLSPILLSARTLYRPKQSLTAVEMAAFVARTHKVPKALVNYGLEKVFSLEATLARFLRFPWGTSILAVFRR